MPIRYPPASGSVLLCDFRGTISPEMCKKRPVIILSSVSQKLCVVVPLSTTEPEIIKKWHYYIKLDPVLPLPYNADFHWVKGDMICTVSFDRLSLPFQNKNREGKRQYVIPRISSDEMLAIKKCILSAMFPGCLDNI